MSLKTDDLFVVQRGNSIYKVPASRVVQAEVTTADVKTVNTRPNTNRTLVNPFSDTPPGNFVTQQDVNWYLYDRTTENVAANAYIGSDPPPNPIVGDLWWSALESNLFIYYFDGNSHQWVDASAAFLNLDYTRIEEYIDNAVGAAGVSQITPGNGIIISPENGKGNVTISFDFDEFAESQAEQDLRIENLETAVRELANRVAKLEDGGGGTPSGNIDGGQADGIYTGTDIDGGDVSGVYTGDDINGGNATSFQ